MSNSWISWKINRSVEVTGIKSEATSVPRDHRVHWDDKPTLGEAGIESRAWRARQCASHGRADGSRLRLLIGRELH